MENLVPNAYRVERRDYLVGDIDDLTDDGPGSDDDAYIDPDWQAFVASSNGLPISGFDALVADQNVAFSIEHQLGVNERVVHATLALAIKQVGGSAADDFIRLIDGAPEHLLSFSSLRWSSSIGTSEAFIGVVDLGQFLPAMQDGIVNVQLSEDVSADWAIFDATVAVPTDDGSKAIVFVDNGADVSVGLPVDNVETLVVGASGIGAVHISADGRIDVADDYMQTADGMVDFELHGTGDGNFGQLLVGDQAVLDGGLAITLDGGFSPAAADEFAVIEATGGIVGHFTDFALPSLGMGLIWQIEYAPTAVLLEVLWQADFDADGDVDGDDFLAWQTGFGTISGATHSACDADIDGDVDGDDFLIWQAQFGNMAGEGGVAALAVPEPKTVVVAAILVLVFSTTLRVVSPRPRESTNHHPNRIAVS